MNLLETVDPANLGAFVIAAILLTLAPGPDNLMVLSLAMAKGRIKGVLFGLGCALGTISHTALAALGISALIAASPIAFTALKVLGGCYLAWLGYQVLRHARIQHAADPKAAAATGAPERVFLKGMIASAINPKVIIFFLAFMPQFVLVERGAVWFQTTVLGLAFGLQAAVIFSLIGYGAGTLGDRMARNPWIGFGLNIAAGVIFLLLAVNLLIGGALSAAG